MDDDAAAALDTKCHDRLSYRAGRKETAVRVYTVNHESRYIVVKNVPALGCEQELVQLFAQYGPIEEYRMMDEVDSAPFTDTFWVKFAAIANSRFAKRKLDGTPFLGSLLQVAYAPEDESLADTRAKLEERRRTVLWRASGGKRGREEAEGGARALVRVRAPDGAAAAIDPLLLGGGGLGLRAYAAGPAEEGAGPPGGGAPGPRPAPPSWPGAPIRPRPRVQVGSPGAGTRAAQQTSPRSRPATLLPTAVVEGKEGPASGRAAVVGGGGAVARQVAAPPASAAQPLDLAPRPSDGVGARLGRAAGGTAHAGTGRREDSRRRI